MPEIYTNREEALANGRLPKLLVGRNTTWNNSHLSVFRMNCAKV
jgi:hypothetical protein